MGNLLGGGGGGIGVDGLGDSVRVALANED